MPPVRICSPVVVLCLAILLSCTTARKISLPLPQTPPYSSLKVSELRTEASTNPTSVLAYLSGIIGDESSSLAGEHAIPELVASALGKIFERYTAAMDQSDWNGALSCFRSLAAVYGIEKMKPLFPRDLLSDMSRPGSFGEQKLLAMQAEAFHEKGFHSASRLLYLRSLRAEPDPFRDPADAVSGRESPGSGPSVLTNRASDLSVWMERASKSGDEYFVNELRKAEKARGTDSETLKSGLSASGIIANGAASPSGDIPAASMPISSMISGVVTVRVDRGIKIENGVGVPDRVIGSGFYIEKSGYILTNYHVVESEVDAAYEGYSRLTIRPAGSPDLRIPAKVIGWDRLLDLALLKTEVKPSYVFTLSGNATLTPGEKILAIGSPAGLESTVTAGIVSAGGRRISQIGEAVQVDAALNPGNSGGPLLDSSGEVAGIVFAGLSQFQGLNFCIPSSWVQAVLPELFRGGEVSHAWLGLVLAQEPEGLEIAYRHPSVPEGISEGDRLVALASRAVADIPSAQMVLAASGYTPGTLISVVLSGKGGKAGSLPGTRSEENNLATKSDSAGPGLTVLRNLERRPDYPMESAAERDSHASLMTALYGMSVKRMPGVFLDPERYTITRIWSGGVADEAGLSVNDPFSVNDFSLDRKNKIVDLVIRVKKRQAGFMESLVSLPASLEIPDIL